MDWMLIVPPIVLCGAGYLVGRVWSFKEYAELQEKNTQLEEKNTQLERDLRRLTTRGPDGRFIRVGK